MRGVVGPNPTPFGEQLREQRRLAGLCFRCGEKYHMGYQCKKQILLLEGDEEPDQEVTEDENEEGIKEDNGEISIHALKGVTNNKIIKVEGQIEGKRLTILIDSGSMLGHLY